ncbi:MAG: hypothetical protein FWC89_11985, partial [Defluviitaleaceae bacterium]|nr:hypothetical protein [Defluviitaleaceae bacterium]
MRGHSRLHRLVAFWLAFVIFLSTPSAFAQTGYTFDVSIETEVEIQEPATPEVSPESETAEQDEQGEQESPTESNNNEDDNNDSQDNEEQGNNDNENNEQEPDNEYTETENEDQTEDEESENEEGIEDETNEENEEGEDHENEEDENDYEYESNEEDDDDNDEEDDDENEEDDDDTPLPPLPLPQRRYIIREFLPFTHAIPTQVPFGTPYSALGIFPERLLAIVENDGHEFELPILVEWTSNHQFNSRIPEIYVFTARPARLSEDSGFYFVYRSNILPTIEVEVLGMEEVSLWFTNFDNAPIEFPFGTTRNTITRDNRLPTEVTASIRRPQGRAGQAVPTREWLSINIIGWNAEASFSSNVSGVYRFTPILSENPAVSVWYTMPTIEVVITDAELFEVVQFVSPSAIELSGFDMEILFGASRDSVNVQGFPRHFDVEIMSLNSPLARATTPYQLAVTDWISDTFHPTTIGAHNFRPVFQSGDIYVPQSLLPFISVTVASPSAIMTKMVLFPNERTLDVAYGTMAYAISNKLPVLQITKEWENICPDFATSPYYIAGMFDPVVVEYIPLWESITFPTDGQIDYDVPHQFKPVITLYVGDFSPEVYAKLQNKANYFSIYVTIRNPVRTIVSITTPSALTVYFGTPSASVAEMLSPVTARVRITNDVYPYDDPRSFVRYDYIQLPSSYFTWGSTNYNPLFPDDYTFAIEITGSSDFAVSNAFTSPQVPVTVRPIIITGFLDLDPYEATLPFGSPYSAVEAERPSYIEVYGVLWYGVDPTTVFSIPITGWTSTNFDSTVIGDHIFVPQLADAISPYPPFVLYNPPSNWPNVFTVTIEMIPLEDVDFIGTRDVNFGTSAAEVHTYVLPDTIDVYTWVLPSGVIGAIM